jgi:hypothetical protein
VHSRVELLVHQALRGAPDALAEPHVPDTGQGVQLRHVRLAHLGEAAGRAVLVLMEQQGVVLVPGPDVVGLAGIAPDLQPVGRHVGVGVRDDLLVRHLPVTQPGRDRLPVLLGEFRRLLGVDDVVLR